MRRAVIVGAARTPTGAISGQFQSIPAIQLGAIAAKHAFRQANLDPALVQEVFAANVCSANLGQAPATQVSRAAGCGWNTPATSVNKVCASGMKAAMFAAQSVQLGLQECVMVTGFESMSNVPYYVPKGRSGYGYGHGEFLDGLIKDGLWDPWAQQHMGMCAEKCAHDSHISRKDQDEYAVLSCNRAIEATKKGLFKKEIAPVEIAGRRKGDPVTVIDQDESLQKIKLDKIPGLKPAFKADGTVTAANASSLNDGGSAMIITSEEFADKHGLKPLGYIRGYADAAKESVDFTTAPSLAVPKALKMAGLDSKDIDYHEVNEAFAVVALANANLLNIPIEKLNVRGGAVALGHPIGSSGLRIMVSLLNILHDNDASFGCASICNGGGGASAIVLERA